MVCVVKAEGAVTAAETSAAELVSGGAVCTAPLFIIKNAAVAANVTIMHIMGVSHEGLL